MFNKLCGIYTEKSIGIYRIDLQLPSGNLWSSCNLGAYNPYEYGDYYSWGELTPKDKNSFTEDNYSEELSKLSVQLPIELDVVHQTLGDNWYTPTQNDFNELLNSSNCTNKWIENYKGIGINGRLITSVRNGNELFFPASGLYYEEGGWNVNNYGYSITSTPNTDDLLYLKIFDFNSVTNY